MPFVGNHANDIGFVSPEGPVCFYDSADGKIKSGEDIFKGGVEFFSSEVTGGDRDLAERLARKNMSSLSHWKKNPFDLLKGPQATDQEFQPAMAKL